MISEVTGEIKAGQKEKELVIMADKIGFSFQTPKPEAFLNNSQSGQTVFIHMHWNQEKGPSLYGFISPQERDIFLLLIDCPKIGPNTGISILSQITGEQFIDAIVTSNELFLGTLKGVGKKTATGIIHHLQDKVSSLIESGNLALSEGSTAEWQGLQEALISLNYSRQEVRDAISYVADKHSDKNNLELNLLLRSALGYLSQNK